MNSGGLTSRVSVITDECNIRIKEHRRQYRSYRTRSNFVFFTSLLTSTVMVLGNSTMSSFPDSYHDTISNSLGVLGVCVAIIQALASHLQYTELMERHRWSMFNFFVLMFDLRLQITLLVAKRGGVRSRPLFEESRARFRATIASAPALSVSFNRSKTMREMQICKADVNDVLTESDDFIADQHFDAIIHQLKAQSDPLQSVVIPIQNVAIPYQNVDNKLPEHETDSIDDELQVDDSRHETDDGMTIRQVDCTINQSKVQHRRPIECMEHQVEIRRYMKIIGSSAQALFLIIEAKGENAKRLYDKLKVPIIVISTFTGTMNLVLSKFDKQTALTASLALACLASFSGLLTSTIQFKKLDQQLSVYKEASQHLRELVGDIDDYIAVDVRHNTIQPHEALRNFGDRFREVFDVGLIVDEVEMSEFLNFIMHDDPQDNSNKNSVL